MGAINDSTAPFQSNEHYGQLRRKLVVYFERRGCRCPEDWADECLSRVFSYTREHGEPTDLNRFTFGFASRACHEWLRDSSRFTSVSTDFPDHGTQLFADGARSLAKAAIEQLDPDDRELMEQYYLDRRTADSMAAEWGLSPEGIRSRVFRKRRKLVEFFMMQGTCRTKQSAAPTHKRVDDGGSKKA